MEWVVWAETIGRGDLQLAPGDVEDSLVWFKNKTGQAPNSVALNPGNQYLASELPKNMRLDLLGGVLAGEVWLSAEDSFVTDFSRTTQAVESTRKCDKSVTLLQTPMGRPSVDLPTKKVLELHDKGLSSRAIARELENEGIRVSYRTIARSIKEHT